MKKIVLVSVAVGFVVWLLAREEGRAKLAPGWSTKQRVGGTLDQVKGTAKRAAGSIVGDRSMEAEGMIDEAIGAVRRGVGRAVDAVTDAVQS